MFLAEQTLREKGCTWHESRNEPRFCMIQTSFEAFCCETEMRLSLQVCLGIWYGDMTPQQDSLLGVIICPSIL
jgi:hypothetical protein